MLHIMEVEVLTMVESYFDEIFNEELHVIDFYLKKSYTLDLRKKKGII